MDAYAVPTLDDEATEEEQQEALIAALRNQQAQGQAESVGLQRTLARQQGQAGQLRTLSLLSSLGQNPLLQGIQRASGEQGAQLEALGARTEQRLTGGRGADPINALLRLRALGQGDKRLKFQQDTTAQRLANERKRLGMAATGAASKAEQDLLAQAESLRKEYASQPEVKKFKELDGAYQVLRQAAQDRSGPAGITTIFTFMKMLDPGVAVMEGDVNLIRSSGGPAAKYANIYESVLTGNPLPESVRQDILRQAAVVHGLSSERHSKTKSRFSRLAAGAKVKPDDVVEQDESPPGNVQTSAKPAPSPASAPDPDTVRVLINGKPMRVPKANLEAVKKRAAERKDTLEVMDG